MLDELHQHFFRTALCVWLRNLQNCGKEHNFIKVCNSPVNIFTGESWLLWTVPVSKPFNHLVPSEAALKQDLDLIPERALSQGTMVRVKQGQEQNCRMCCRPNMSFMKEVRTTQSPYCFCCLGKTITVMLYARQGTHSATISVLLMCHALKISMCLISLLFLLTWVP